MNHEIRFFAVVSIVVMLGIVYLAVT